jgi:glutaredoxin
MKRIFGIIGLIFCLVLSSFSFLKAENKLKLYFFSGDGCPHCAQEELYLDTIKHNYNIDIQTFEIYNNQSNALLLQEVAKTMNIQSLGVPLLIIGDQYIIGYGPGTSNEINSKIKYCLSNECFDVVGPIIDPDSVIETTTTKDKKTSQEENTDRGLVSLPFIGEIDINNFSLPAITILIGFLDGFNPCAMWVLLFLVTLLLGMKDRKKMWILGVSFIVASALVYFIFISAWLNLILFLGFIGFVKIIIGMAALFCGGYNIKEYFTNKTGACKITGTEKKQKIFQKLKNVVLQNNFWFALLGIIALAFMVNLVELVCSAGLPAIYTQVLALNNLSKVQYYMYILLYIFFFMLDDLFVFFVSMTTLRITGVTTKYTRYSKLVGGILMLIIGILLIFKPELLMWG